MALTRRSGSIMEPDKTTIYGVEGVGKSTLAATYPNPIFFDFEGSTTKMDVEAFGLERWEDFEEAVQLVLNNEDYKDRDTVVIDTMDWAERVMIDKILELDQETSITAEKKYGFGRGDERIKEFVNKYFLPRLQQLHDSGRNIVLLGHAGVMTNDDPLNGKYNYYGINMTKKASAVIREWSQNVFFLNYKYSVKEGKGFEKNTVSGGTEVVLFTKRTPQFEAKTRLDINMSYYVKKDINPLHEHVGTIQALKFHLAKLEAVTSREELAIVYRKNYMRNEEYAKLMEEKGKMYPKPVVEAPISTKTEGEK